MPSVKNKAYVKAASEAIRRKGGRLTLNQLYAIEALADAEGPMTCIDIIARINELHGQVLPAKSVYRSMDNLKDARAVVNIGAVKGSIFRREDCAETVPGVPVLFVDPFNEEAKSLADAEGKIEAFARQIIAHFKLPETDYSVQIVAGTSFVAGGL